MIDEQKVLYKISSGRFFERMKKTTEWTEAKELLKEAIARSKKHTAYLYVFYGEDRPLASVDVTDPSVIEKPRLKAGLTYDEIIKEAIDTKACAGANDDIAVFIVDKIKAKASGTVRLTNRIKTRTGEVVSVVRYATEDEAKKTLDQAKKA